MVLPLFDPPREVSEATIATASQLSVKVKMVTGDQIAMAKEVRRLGETETGSAGTQPQRDSPVVVSML